MNEGPSTAILMAYTVANIAANQLGWFLELTGSDNSTTLPPADDTVALLGALKITREMTKLCCIDAEDNTGAISDLEQLHQAIKEFREFVYSKYLLQLPHVVADANLQLPKAPFGKYLEEAIKYMELALVDQMFNSLHTQSANMALSASIRLLALSELPLQATRDPNEHLDFDAVATVLKQVAEVTSTELFKPSREFMEDYETVDQVEKAIRTALQDVASDLAISFVHDTENSLRTMLSYLIAYCEVGKAMVGINHPSTKISL